MAEPVGVEDAVGDGAATVVDGETDGVGVADAAGGGVATLDAGAGALVLLGADELGPGAA